MKMFYLNGIGLLAPGLRGWRESVFILKGTSAYHYQEIPALRSTLLPVNERRRTTHVIGLALQVAQEAITQAGVEAQQLYSVFASAEGDSEIIDKICTALTRAERPVSPTLFHNSVHNAPAGYWSIATGCTLPSTSLSAYDDSFSAGLLEAATLVLIEQTSVLLVVYDYPPPFPLSQQRGLYAPFATALLLSPKKTAQSWARLQLQPIAHGVEDRLDQENLERLRIGNPAARSLPLLRAIATGTACDVVLPYSATHRLSVAVEP